MLILFLLGDVQSAEVIVIPGLLLLLIEAELLLLLVVSSLAYRTCIAIAHSMRCNTLKRVALQTVVLLLRNLLTCTPWSQ
jgi:hypothetical protein